MGPSLLIPVARAVHRAFAKELQRVYIGKSNTINTRGNHLKNLAREGKIDDALAVIEPMAAAQNKIMNCGYAACGYALLTEHLTDDDPRKEDWTIKAIDLTRKLIGHGHRDFDAMRKTDLDFAPLQQNQAFLDMLDEEESKVAEERDTTP